MVAGAAAMVAPNPAGAADARGVPCTIGDTNRTGCAWRFYYADVSQALAFYGACIRTA